MSSHNQNESSPLVPGGENVLNSPDSDFISQPQAREKLTAQVVIAVSIAALSPVQFGYGLAVINNPAAVIKQEFSSHGQPITQLSWSLVVSIFLLAGGLGSTLPSFFLGYLKGLKRMIILNSLIFMTGYCLSTFAQNVGMLIAGRFITGLASGVSMVTAPMYINQISPSTYRGSLGSTVQLGISSGIILSELTGMGSIFGNPQHWRVIFALPGIFSLITLVILPFYPNSPLDMVRYRDVSEARKCLQRLRGYDVTVEEELRNILQTTGKNSKVKVPSYTTIFRKHNLRKPALISIMLMSIQQLSGRNVINFFSTSLFIASHVPHPDFVTLITGLACIPVGIISLFIMDMFSRRVMLKTGLLGIIFGFSLLGVCSIYSSHIQAGYTGVLSILIVVFFFGFSIGPMAPFLVCEISPPEITGKIMAMAGVCNWVSNFLVGFSFSYLQKTLGNYVMFFYAALNVIFLVMIYFLVPETKDLKPTEIQELYFTKKNNTSRTETIEEQEEQVEEETVRLIKEKNRKDNKAVCSEDMIVI